MEMSVVIDSLISYKRSIGYNNDIELIAKVHIYQVERLVPMCMRIFLDFHLLESIIFNQLRPRSSWHG